MKKGKRKECQGVPWWWQHGPFSFLPLLSGSGLMQSRLQIDQNAVFDYDTRASRATATHTSAAASAPWTEGTLLAVLTHVLSSVSL